MSKSVILHGFSGTIPDLIREKPRVAGGGANPVPGVAIDSMETALRQPHSRQYDPSTCEQLQHAICLAVPPASLLPECPPAKEVLTIRVSSKSSTICKVAFANWSLFVEALLKCEPVQPKLRTKTGLMHALSECSPRSWHCF